MKPYPKQKRIVNKRLLARIRSLGYCMLSGHSQCWGGLDAHHIIGKGAGGNDLEDNIALLCRFHHSLMHMKKIDEPTLRFYMAKNKHLHENA